jgi:hypothetical protein
MYFPTHFPLDLAVALSPFVVMGLLWLFES